MTKRPRIMASIATVALTVLAACDSSRTKAERPSVAQELRGVDQLENIGQFRPERAAQERFQIRNR